MNIGKVDYINTAKSPADLLKQKPTGKKEEKERNSAMMLLTKENLRRLPKMGETSNEDNPICQVKLFCPWSSWTWYLIEYDPVDDIGFGYVEGIDNELGNIDIGELRSLVGPMGLKIERDKFFTPTPLKTIMENSPKPY